MPRGISHDNMKKIRRNIWIFNAFLRNAPGICCFEGRQFNCIHFVFVVRTSRLKKKSFISRSISPNISGWRWCERKKLGVTHLQSATCLSCPPIAEEQFQVVHVKLVKSFLSYPAATSTSSSVFPTQFSLLYASTILAGKSIVFSENLQTFTYFLALGRFIVKAYYHLGAWWFEINQNLQIYGNFRKKLKQWRCNCQKCKSVPTDIPYGTQKCLHHLHEWMFTKSLFYFYVATFWAQLR